DIIVERYAPRHPGLAVVGDVAEGRYAIGVRPADRDLLAAIDAALGRLIGSGELRAILRRYGVDGDRQARLATLGAAGARAPDGASARWPTGGQLLLFLQGAVATLVISAAAMALAIGLGLGLALARLYAPRARPFATLYVELVRGTPVLLQLYVLYYGLGGLLSLPAWAAAIIGLGLNYAAYEAEIYRAGILAVPRGQMEAALSLGMTTRVAL